MGPGYFPMMLGILLAIIGIGVIFLQGWSWKPRTARRSARWAWKPLGFIIGANLPFGLLLGGLPSIRHSGHGPDRRHLCTDLHRQHGGR
jgi:hypothetical protein